MLDRDTLIKKIREVSESLGKASVSRSEFSRATKINEYQILKHFDSWNEFVQESGLVPDDRTRISDDELFAAMRDAFVAEGGVTTRTRFGKVCRYSVDVYKKRWGRWSNILLAFRRWIGTRDPAFQYLKDLPNSDAQQRSMAQKSVQSAQDSAHFAEQRAGGRQYGEFLNFRGLQHAPINEQGVVFLFGMVAQDLGYIVERVESGFPDCEAKRRIGGTGNRLERVRIEFEYKSRNFRDHGHDSSECDVIVCWEHNWPECPVEVLELKTEIKSLKAH